MKWVSKSAERRKCQGLYNLTIFYTVYIYCVFWVHGWLLKRKDNTQASSCESKKTKSQVLVDKYKYKSSTSRGQSASSLSCKQEWRLILKWEGRAWKKRANSPKNRKPTLSSLLWASSSTSSAIFSIHSKLQKRKKCTKDMAVNMCWCINDQW